MKLNFPKRGVRTEENKVTERTGATHGRDKQPEADDPMELLMSAVPGGDPETMATCIIEEYARTGMGEEEILSLFNQPVYRTFAFYQKWGECRVRDLIRKTLGRTGQARVSVQTFYHIGQNDV